MENLRHQVRALAAPPESVQGMSDRVRAMLRLAEDEVAEMLGAAELEVGRRTRRRTSARRPDRGRRRDRSGRSARGGAGRAGAALGRG